MFTHLSSSVLSSIIVGICFIIPNLWPISLLGIALFIYSVISAPSFKSATLSAYLFGVVLWSFAVGAVFFGALPLDWYGINSALLQVLLVTGSMLLVVSTVAVSFPLAAVLIRYLYTNSWRDVLIIPSVWVLSEYVGGIMFYLMSFGPGSLFGPHFSIGWVGYIIATDSMLLQFAYIGGVFILSFITVAIGTIIFKFFYNKEKNAKKGYLYTLFMLIVLLVTAHMFINVDTSPNDNKLTSHSVSIATVSRQQPPILVLTEAQDERYSNEVYEAIKPLRDVEILVFPEETSFLESLGGKNANQINTTLKNIGVNNTPPTIIDSSSALGSDWRLRSEVSYYTDGQNKQVSYKQLLVPIGEYLPSLYSFVLDLFSESNLSKSVQGIQGYVPGYSAGSVSIDGTLLATRFCAEVMSPSLYRDNVLGGAEVLVNISSLSWFHGSTIVYNQMKRIAKVRAVENGRWYVQSGNKASAFILDNRGQVVSETLWNETESIQTNVPRLKYKTLYTILGYWVLIFPILFIILFNKKRSLYKILFKN